MRNDYAKIFVVIVFPNGKINLGLFVHGKRTDGYHNLETVFYPVNIRDILEIIPLSEDKSAESKKEDWINFVCTGLPVDGNINDNLCVKAFYLLKKDFPALPAVHIHLHKVIPMGAGLGGGSADGAFTLKLINEKFGLNLATRQLIDYAIQLGSDCPFFIINKPCYATGRGEVLEEITLDLSAYSFVIVNPGIHINTRWAFSAISSSVSGTSRFRDKNVKDMVLQPVETWKEVLVNDFEIAVFEKYPEVESIKKYLYDQGAIYAAMSGSGSTVFGMYPRHEKMLQHIGETLENKTYKVYKTL